MPRNLTIKQRKFISAVADHGNATQAAVDAGYDVVIKKGVAAGLFENPVLKLIKKALQEPALAQKPEIASAISSWSG